MWRRNSIAFPIVVLGAVLIAIVAPHSNWEWHAEHHVEVPTTGASWVDTSTGEDPEQVIVVVPPYIILEAVANQGAHMVGQQMIQISIQTMSGTYSRYVASTLAEPKALPVLLVSPDRPGSISRLPFELTASH